MALEKYRGVASSRKRKPPQVLDEEAYTENLERIIVRDFFPDHGQLKDQKEYLEAEEKKDFEKMREIALKYSTGQKAKRTNINEPESVIPIPSPATFETPVLDGRLSPGMSSCSSNLLRKAKKDNNLGYQKSDTEESDEGRVKQSDEADGLNSFLSKYTSEDNESFETIMESTDEARKRKYAWLYDAEVNAIENQKQMLMLKHEAEVANKPLAIKDKPENDATDSEKSSNKSEENESELKSSGQGAIVGKLYESEDDRKSHDVDTWAYKAKNHLMYYPEGIPDDNVVFKKPYAIQHTNTRFRKDPFKDALDRTKLVEAAAENAKFNVGERVGHDGKAILPSASPSVNGFGFVATPSPAPGVNMSPIMTWGAIDSTPIRIDNSGTPTPGPSFRFPSESRRDELMYKMVDENTKKKRAKKKAALKQVKDSILAGTPRRVGSIMSSERINTLSPAARRLVSGNKKLGLSSDRRLRQSYTPSPRTSNRGDLTPVTKTPTPRNRLTPKVSGANTPSITDNLLNISSKKKKNTAADFF